jgi:anti-sigma regulatory factor (Ser/Thr protein kinase)
MTQTEMGRIGLPASAMLGIDALHVPANRRRSQAAWCDVFALGTERFVVSIGNVAGGEAESGALTRAVREAFDFGSAGPEPQMLLNAAAAIVRGRTAPGAPAVSATVGIIDCLERSFTYVSAGHPPPFVRYGDGTVAALPADGPTGRDHPPAQVVVDLNDAALLLLYSSALVQVVSDAEDGLRRVQGVLADERMADCSAPAAWIARQILGDVSHDEAAVISLTLAPGAGVNSADKGKLPHWSAAWSFDTRSAASNGARRAFLACLKSKAGQGVAIDLAAAELIFGELLGNVVRHSPGRVDIILDWTAVLPVLHVLDRGPGFRSRRKRERLPVDELSESGRGLFIVNACAPDFSVRNRNGRGTHASATLPPA